MTIVDVGSGPPVILVPGIQGRWEWMKPAVDALSARCRVVRMQAHNPVIPAVDLDTVIGDVEQETVLTVALGMEAVSGVRREQLQRIFVAQSAAIGPFR